VSNNFAINYYQGKWPNNCPIPTGANANTRLNVPQDRTDFPPNEVFNWHKGYAIKTWKTFATNPPNQ